MSDIPVSSIVNVPLTIGAQFPARAGFGTLNIITAETGVIGPAERARKYSNAAGVAGDWPSNSEVVKAANTYFSQRPRPNSLVVSTRFDADQAGQLRGSSVTNNLANIATISNISDGSMSIAIDGDSQDISDIDFTGDATLSDIASTLEASLQAVASGGFTACSVDYDGSSFTITSGTTGVGSSVGFADAVNPADGTDISELFNFRQGQGLSSPGIAAETITEALTRIQEADDSWYFFAFTREIRDNVSINGEAAVLAAAAWAESRTKTFFTVTNSLSSYDSTIESGIGFQLNATGYRRTIITLASLANTYPDVSAAGRMATTDFESPNTTTTLKFKQLPGIPTESIGSNQKSVLDARNINAYITVGGSDIFAEGVMTDGTFFDEVHGLDWLLNSVQTNAFGTLVTSPNKLAYTDEDVNALEQSITRSLDQAVANGLSAPGTSADGVFLPQGYVVTTVPVENVSSSDRAARFYSGLGFTLLGAGALHGLQINATFER